jgi:hypothetical protein
LIGPVLCMSHFGSPSPVMVKVSFNDVTLWPCLGPPQCEYNIVIEEETNTPIADGNATAANFVCHSERIS